MPFTESLTSNLGQIWSSLFVRSYLFSIFTSNFALLTYYFEDKMVEVKFPVSLPKFTDEDFEKERQEYVSKHGYYVSPPKLSEIIHIRIHNEPDDEEWEKYTSSELSRTHPDRAYEIGMLLDKKRAQRDKMLASPTPTWARNLASVMTVFDDINDTLGTIGVVMRIAARLAPKVLARFFMGPIGWLFLAAELAGLFLAVMRLPFSCISKKRTYNKVRELNPFSKKAKIRRARKMRRLRLSKGEWIEAAQTADNVFGIGLCLGPLLGWGYDILSGIVREVRGEEVHWRTPPPSRPNHIKPAARLVRFSQVLHLADDEMSDDDHLAFMIALNGATQALKPYIDEWNPMDQVDDFDKVLFEAPVPEHPTTKFILAEVGIDDGQAIGWPGLDKRFATWEQLWDACQPSAAKRYMNFSTRNRNNYVGLCGAQNGHEFGLNMMQMLEGYETVDEEMEPAWRGFQLFLEYGCETKGCGTFWRPGCPTIFNKTTAHQLGKLWLVVSGCSKPSTYFKDYHAGGRIKCAKCNMYIGTGMAPAGFNKWVVSAGIFDEAYYLELLRKRIIR